MNNEIYNKYSFNCLDLIKICCLNLDGYSAFLLGNAIKYVYRAGIKTVDSKEDLSKALDYLKEFKVFSTKNCLRFKNYIKEGIFYKYIILFINMEQYKAEFFTTLLFCLYIDSVEEVEECMNIINKELRVRLRKGE